MADYDTLKNLENEDFGFNRTNIALRLASDKVLRGNDNVAPYDQTAGAHDKRVRFAYRVYRNADSEARDVWPQVLAKTQNDTPAVTETAIRNAGDQAYLDAVEALYDELSNGLEFDEPTTP